MRFELTDSRRLTGANLYWDRPSAIIDVSIEGAAEDIIEAWEKAAAKWLDAVGYAEEATCYRVYQGGASLLISAPIDVLYSMCELNETAWASAVATVTGAEDPDPVEEVPRLTRLFDEERNPALLALQQAAHQHGVPFLWDDDEVSVGYGRSTLIWTPDALPDPDEIDWSALGGIPVAMVTGTNGKSTTVRMTAAIMTAAGFLAGLTSTDFIRVGDRVIDTGDYSGTGGARMLMRQGDVEMAVLEVARGGLLRRGLGLESADVVAITNVAADHLGDYGINSVPELIPAKFIVSKALHGDAPLVLNADDQGMVDYAAGLNHPVTWFSLDPEHPLLRKSTAGGGTVCYFENGWIVVARGSSVQQVAPVEEIPATMGGIVRYNLSNAMAATCIAVSLDIPTEAIRKGLAVFRGDEHDNPGRGNWFEKEFDGGSVKILVDFAHNEHGMRALADAVRQVPAERVILLMGQAGDRLDKDIADLVHAACSVWPAQLLVAELPGYERGRESNEVPRLIRREAIAYGVPEGAIEMFSSPGEATAEALARARPGDLLVLLALTQRNEALALVHEYLGNGAGHHG
jgi:UDP-N-acetylmuramyl tripeptide synthase